MPNVNGSYKYEHPERPGKLISRQRLYQLRKVRKGFCPKCGRKKRKDKSTGRVAAGLCTVCYPRVRVQAA